MEIDRKEPAPGYRGPRHHRRAVPQSWAAPCRVFPDVGKPAPVLPAAHHARGGHRVRRHRGGLAPVAYRVFERAAGPPPAAGFDRFAGFASAPRDRFFSLLLLAGCTAIVLQTPHLRWRKRAGRLSHRPGGIQRLAFGVSQTAHRFWVLFAFVACVNIFFSYGARIEGVPFLTREGLDLTIWQWLRLWTWLQVSAILSHFNFHAVMLEVLSKVFPGHRETLFAGVLALEYFPGIAEDGKAYVRKRSAATLPGKKPDKVNVIGHGGAEQWAAALYDLVLVRMGQRTPANCSGVIVFESCAGSRLSQGWAEGDKKIMISEGLFL